MDKVTDAKTEFRLKQWTRIIQTCRASDMTVVAWCAQNNIHIKAYYYWLRRLRTLACESGQLAAYNNENRIVPMEYKPATTNISAAITIHLPSVSIDIRDGASKTTIEDVLSAVKKIC